MKFWREGYGRGVQLDMIPWQLKILHGWRVTQKPIQGCGGDTISPTADRLASHGLHMHLQAILKMRDNQILICLSLHFR